MTKKGSNYHVNGTEGKNSDSQNQKDNVNAFFYFPIR